MNTNSMIDIDKILTVYEGKHILFKICMEMVFYTTELVSDTRKQAVLTMLEEYGNMFESQIHWTANADSARWKKIEGLRSWAHPEDWLPGIGNRRWDFVYTGGSDKKDASDIVFLAVGKPEFNEHVSLVCVRFPLELLGRSDFSFPLLMRHWANLLKPWHARAGLSLSSSFFLLDDSAAAEVKQTELLLQFPGLQFCKYSEGLRANPDGGLYSGIRCADWLLLLSEPFVAKLGGASKITEAMKPLPVLKYSEGLILQAGDYPQIGSAHLKKNIPEYEHVARIVEPIRAKNLIPDLHIFDPTNQNFTKQSKELSTTWYSRFNPQ